MEYFGGDLVVWDFNDDDRVLDEIDLSLPLFLGGNVVSSSFFWFFPYHKSSPIYADLRSRASITRGLKF